MTLYGIALVYGATGEVLLDRVAVALADPAELPPVAGVGVVLAVGGFAFKVAAVPFHAWAPDAYPARPCPSRPTSRWCRRPPASCGLVLLLAVGSRPTRTRGRPRWRWSRPPR